MLNRGGWRTRFCSLFALFALGGASVHSQSLTPAQVVDLRAAAGPVVGASDLAAVDIVQNNGRWVALLTSPTVRRSVMVAGDDQGFHLSNVIQTGADRIEHQIALDGSGVVYMRVKADAPNSTEIDVSDWGFKASARHTFAGSEYHPISFGTDIAWRQGANGDRLFRLGTADPVARLTQTGEQSQGLPDEIRAEPRLLSGLPGGRTVQIGFATEEVVVRSADGQIVTHSMLALDDAYRLAGQSPPIHDPLSGVLRVMWGSVSRTGQVFLCLSGLPAAKPAYIGVFDPLTGRAVRVIEAQLPHSPARIDPQYNPDGQIIPARGAVDDRLVILDEPLGIVALYKLN